MLEDPNQREKNWDAASNQELREYLLNRILPCSDEDLISVSWKIPPFSMLEDPNQREKNWDAASNQELREYLLNKILPCTDEVLMAIIGDDSGYSG